MQGRRMGTSGRAIIKSTSVSGEMYTLERNDGSQSDTAVGTVGAGGKKRRSSLSAKVVAIVSRRSRSTSQLSQTGEPRALHLPLVGCVGDAGFVAFEPGLAIELCVYVLSLFLSEKKNLLNARSLFFLLCSSPKKVTVGRAIKYQKPCLQIRKEMQRSV